MISRYARPEAAAIWSSQTKYKIWFEIEAHAADAMAEIGRHPEARRRDDLGKRQGRCLGQRPHRRDRARHQA
jgi:adenylosuccinate lyase